MISAQARYFRCSFSVDGQVVARFKEAASRDHVSMARLVEQFLLSYVYCLDPAFVDVDVKTRPRIRREHYVVRVSADIYTAFVEKTGKEKTDINLILARFFINYSEFSEKLGELRITDE